MLKINGKVINLFTQEGGQSKDGTEYAERHKVQLMGERLLPNGDKQIDIVDLTIQDLSDWSDFQGKDISIDISPYVYKGSIVYSTKGSKPQLAAY